MRITIVIPTFYPAVIYGGPTFSSLYTCRALAKQNQYVSVVTTNVNREKRLDVSTKDWVSMDGFRVRYFKETITDRFSWDMLWEITPILKKSDVVHVQPIFNFSTLLTLWICKRNNIPVFISPRGAMGNWIMGQGLKFKKIWLNHLMKPLITNARWFATSEQEKEEIKNHYSEAIVEVIPNGIELDEYVNATTYSRREFMQTYAGCQDTPDFILVSLGRLHKKKGYDILLPVIKRLRNSGVNLRLFIAGDDEGEKASLQSWITENEMGETIYIIDPISGQNKINFLSNADLFVLTSHNENFGNVYAEALAAGTPIIASIYTPWLDVEKFGCGRTVDLNPDSIFDAIKNQLLNQDRSEVRELAQKYVAQFSWSNVGTKYIAYYNQCLKNTN